MKYKLEFWPFGEFETAEAADRLNRRAREGWELVNITGCDSEMILGSAMGWNLALYQRNPAAVGYRYTADIVPNRDGGDYIAFCCDGGWEKLLEMNSGLCIFLSRDGGGRPLHTSREVEYFHQMEVLEKNHVSTSIVSYVAWIAICIAMVYGLYKILLTNMDGANLLLYLLPCYLVTWLREPVVYCVNVQYVKYARRRIADGKAAGKPKWLARLSGFLSALSGIVYIYTACFALFAGWMEGASLLLVGIMLIVVIALYVSGIGVQVFKNRAALSNGLIIAGFLCSLMPLIWCAWPIYGEI